jgi:hypothetical protein
VSYKIKTCAMGSQWEKQHGHEIYNCNLVFWHDPICGNSSSKTLSGFPKPVHLRTY